MSESLPTYFCWTKFGVEAGESITNILKRKEEERRANSGIFLWGIGNALGPSILALLEKTKDPEVIFSPIKSKPKVIDVSPAKVVKWQRGETLDGHFYDLPAASMVTSRSVEGRSSHYALICKSMQPLSISSQPEEIKYSQLRNLRTGNPLGYSQVTSVVHRVSEQLEDDKIYSAAIRAQLVYPYFVKLTDPIDNLTRPRTRNKYEAQNLQYA